MKWDGNDRRSGDSSKLDAIWHKLDQLYTSIHGNGGVGLKTKVDRNTSFRKVITWAVAIFVGGGGATTLVLLAIKHFTGG